MFQLTAFSTFSLNYFAKNNSRKSAAVGIYLLTLSFYFA